MKTRRSGMASRAEPPAAPVETAQKHVGTGTTSAKLPRAVQTRTRSAAATAAETAGQPPESRATPPPPAAAAAAAVETSTRAPHAAVETTETEPSKIAQETTNSAASSAAMETAQSGASPVALESTSATALQTSKGQHNTTTLTLIPAPVPILPPLPPRSSPPGPSHPPFPSGRPWESWEVRALLGLWGAPEMQERLRTSLRNHGIYKSISEGLVAKGVWRSAEQCRDKAKKLKDRYRKHRAALEKTKEKGKKRFKFFRSLEAILGGGEMERRRGGEEREREMDQSDSSDTGELEREMEREVQEEELEDMDPQKSMQAAAGSGVNPTPSGSPPPAPGCRPASPSLSMCNADSNTDRLSPIHSPLSKRQRRGCRGKRGGRRRGCHDSADYGGDEEEGGHEGVLMRFLRESDAHFLQLQSDFLSMEREEREADRRAWEEGQRGVSHALLQLTQAFTRQAHAHAHTHGEEERGGHIHEEGEAEIWRGGQVEGLRQEEGGGQTDGEGHMNADQEGGGLRWTAGEGGNTGDGEGQIEGCSYTLGVSRETQSLHNNTQSVHKETQTATQSQARREHKETQTPLHSHTWNDHSYT
ncbi:sterile alpha motif domain-containing protein 1 isoform X2 [Amia ocellicauda]